MALLNDCNRRNIYLCERRLARIQGPPSRRPPSSDQDRAALAEHRLGREQRDLRLDCPAEAILVALQHPACEDLDQMLTGVGRRSAERRFGCAQRADRTAGNPPLRIVTILQS